MVSYMNCHMAIGKSLLGQLAVDSRFASGLCGYGKNWRVRKTFRDPEIKKPSMRKEGEKLNRRHRLIMPRFVPTFNYYFSVCSENFSFML